MPFFCNISLNYIFLNHLRQTYFFQTNSLILEFETVCYYLNKKSQVSNAKIKDFFVEKKSLSQMIQKCLIQREMAQMIPWKMVLFGVNSEFLR